MENCIYESMDGKEADTSLSNNPCYNIPLKLNPESVSVSATSPPVKLQPKSKKPVCSWLCMCALVGFILVGSAAFASLALTVWNVTQVDHQNFSISRMETILQQLRQNSSISKLEMMLQQLQISMSGLESGFQMSINSTYDELDTWILQFQNFMNDSKSELDRIRTDLNNSVSELEKRLQQLHNSVNDTMSGLERIEAHMNDRLSQLEESILSLQSTTNVSVSELEGRILMNMDNSRLEFEQKLVQLQTSVNASKSELERRIMNESMSDLERIVQIQNAVNQHIEIQVNLSRSFELKLSSIILQLNGQNSNSPAASCSHVLLLNSSSPSGHYWIRSSNGSAVRVYCDFNRQCGCDGPSTWTRVAFLNMSDPDQVCPNSWNTISSPVRTCGRGLTLSKGCSSVSYSTFGITYSRVCGRILAYHHGIPEAFNEIRIEQPYLDGVSLTHGSVGSRQHIWSFVDAAGETGFPSTVICACSNINDNWPHSTSFIGNDYFCDTGNHGGPPSSPQFLSDDPLWDGQGCGPYSTCCQFNNPPWFCKTLPQSTTDDLEVRICKDFSDEDSPIQLLELYIQ